MKKTIIGSGIFNLDIIIKREYPEWPLLRPFTDRVALEEVGGTCGNVMCMLSRMGWNARPVACLDDSPEGMKIAGDLASFGCDCRYVTNLPTGGTTILRCTHKRDQDGGRRMSVRAGSPGGSRFPKRHFLRIRDEVPDLMEKVDDVPAVYFFDDPAAGNRMMARAFGERGALVWFEPSRIATSADLDAVRASDIIKFSDENVPDVSFTDAFPDKVFIQTLGPKGARIRFNGGPWQVVAGEPLDQEAVVDTEGAGDTFTSAFLDALAERLGEGFEGIDIATVLAAASYAQETAAKSVCYLGSKGYFRRIL